MSEIPKRTEDEEQKIRTRAHEFWVAAGHEEGRDLDFWLDAEACLQGQRQISRRLIDLPGTLSFTAYGLPDPFPEACFELPMASDGQDLPYFAPIPTSDPRSPIELTAREATHLLPHLSLDPTSLPHDARLVAVQIAVIVATLDRIARVADFTAWSAIKNKSSATDSFDGAT